MCKLGAFFIIFDGIEEPIFFPGQVINGSVVIDLNASMNIRAVKITIIGQCTVYWTERNGEIYHYGYEEYFKHSLSLCGKDSGNLEDVTKLQAGDTMLPFTFQLPTRLPSSFKGKIGYVRYYIKATIDKPFGFNHNKYVHFKVLNKLNLNLEIRSKLPVTSNASKKLCCWYCKSGPIQAELYLQRMGYAPGEFILIKATVENMSSSNVQRTKAILVQSVTFTNINYSKVKTKEVAMTVGPGCRAGGSIEWNNERLHVPTVPSSKLRFCRLINIDYFLKFVVVICGHSNLKVEVPVLIGTIPLKGSTPYNLPPVATPFTEPPASSLFMPSSSVFSSSIPSPSNATTPLPAPPLPASSLPAPPLSASRLPALVTPSTSFQAPPPSYAANVGDSVNIKDGDDNDYMMGEDIFSPQRTYYDWSKSTVTYTNK